VGTPVLFLLHGEVGDIAMENQRLRVALFTETFLPKVDGIVTIMKITLDHFRARGVEAMVFAAGDRVDAYAGYPVVSMRGVPAPMYPDLELALPGPGVYEQLRDFAPDVVHVLNPVMSGLVGLAYARRLGVPVMMSFHTHLMEMARFYNYGVFERLLWGLHRLAYNRADCVLATSERIVAELSANGIRNVGLWRRGVDITRFSPHYATTEMRARLTDGHPERTILLSAGRLAPEKQVEQIAPVLEQLRGTDVHLAIVGDGPQRPKLEQVFAGYPVTLVGYLHGEALSSAFASADLFLFPSSSIETFGLVAGEALASGTAVVASDVGGMREIIRHGENGYIFPENDTEAFAGYVAELVDDVARREQFSARGRASMLGRTWTRIMDELLDEYTALVGQSARMTSAVV
jgi:glycosyltransferase involved in cell wall biosynthesis